MAAVSRLWKKQGKSDGGKQDSGEEGGAVAMVEEVAGFEVFVMGGVGLEEARVHQAIGSVEHPDGDGHGKCGGDGKVDVVGGGDEPRPEYGDGGGVEREKVPERERAGVVADRFEGRLSWSCGSHLVQFIPAFGVRLPSL